MKQTTKYCMKLKYAYENLYTYLHKAGVLVLENEQAFNSYILLTIMLLESNRLLIDKNLDVAVPYENIWELEESINILKRGSYILNYSYTLSGRAISVKMNIHLFNPKSAKIIILNPCKLAA